MLFLSLSLFCILAVTAQQDQPSSTFPNAYGGQPGFPYSPEWQTYFEVTELLPNITFPLPRSYAGNINVDRSGHPNNTLFFWAFEKSNGSLTDSKSDEPWLIWLQGGPGASSLVGLLFENGPMAIQDDSSFKPNEYSWDKLIDSFWVDNPVGTGFATADSTGYVADDDQMAEDFVRFLANLVKVFPGLSARPLVLTGESYAGRWIPYIARNLFQRSDPPVLLKTMAIGDGVVAEYPVISDATVVTLIETYPQVIGYDTEILRYFQSQQHLCGYDLNLSYPQAGGKFQTLQYVSPTDPNSPYYISSAMPLTEPALDELLSYRKVSSLVTRTLELSSRRHPPRSRNRPREVAQRLRKRDLFQRMNGSIDSWYGCFLQNMLYDYMLNFTYPWNVGPGTLDPYYLPDALASKPPTSPASFIPVDFLHDLRTINAIHAPAENWTEFVPYPFYSIVKSRDFSPAPQTFMDDLAANASSGGVKIILYSGNDDALVPHRGYEILMQNLTFGGIQGFIRKPSTPWYDDHGNVAGIVHQERNMTYVLFKGAGHQVPSFQSNAAFVFLREFVLSQNKTGLVVSDEKDQTSVIGGELSSFLGGILTGQDGIYMGNYSTTATYKYPEETVSAWNDFIATATVTARESRVN